MRTDLTDYTGYSEGDVVRGRRIVKCRTCGRGGVLVRRARDDSRYVVAHVEARAEGKLMLTVLCPGVAEEGKHGRL